MRTAARLYHTHYIFAAAAAAAGGGCGCGTVSCVGNVEESEEGEKFGGGEGVWREEGGGVQP